jgi:Mrp family chromosome partitioning ATPase
LGVDGSTGLSNYLAGHDHALEAIIHDERFGMDVLVSGPVPPNAAELLTGPRLEHLLDH